LSGVLRGWLGTRKRRTGRTHYCTVALLRTYGEPEQRKRVLQRARELVPYVWFIELNPESGTVESEFTIIEGLEPSLPGDRAAFRDGWWQQHLGDLRQLSRLRLAPGRR